MKKRLILKKDIKKAYSQDREGSRVDLDIDSSKSDIDKLPKEIFEILGEILCFIQTTNKLEEDQHENK